MMLDRVGVALTQTIWRRMVLEEGHGWDFIRFYCPSLSIHVLIPSLCPAFAQTIQYSSLASATRALDKEMETRPSCLGYTRLVSATRKIFYVLVIDLVCL